MSPTFAVREIIVPRYGARKRFLVRRRERKEKASSLGGKRTYKKGL